MYLLDPSKMYGADLLINNDLRRVTGRSWDKKLIIHLKKNLLARVLNNDTVGSCLNKSCCLVCQSLISSKWSECLKYPLSPQLYETSQHDMAIRWVIMLQKAICVSNDRESTISKFHFIENVPKTISLRTIKCVPIKQKNSLISL